MAGRNDNDLYDHPCASCDAPQCDCGEDAVACQMCSGCWGDPPAGVTFTEMEEVDQDLSLSDEVVEAKVREWEMSR